MTPYRSSAAVSLAAIGEKAEAVRLANEELELARRWGTGRAVGVAQRTLGVAHGDEHGVELLIEATSTLQDSPAPVEHARALVDLGAAVRRQGARSQSSEFRVARLAAEGRTNSEIAQLLFITPRTVETHLTSSYAKLGIRSRRELAGALDPPGSG